MSKRTIDSFFSKAPKKPRISNDTASDDRQNTKQHNLSGPSGSGANALDSENAGPNRQAQENSTECNRQESRSTPSPSPGSAAVTSNVQTTDDGKKTLKEQGKPACLQKFKDTWIDSAEFLCFEKYRKDPYYAFCKVCLDKLSVGRGGKSNLTTHLQTKRHREAANKIKDTETPNIENYSLSDKVYEAELKLTSWAVEHNISFAAVDKLAQVVRTLDDESKVLPMIRLGRTKAASVVSGVIASSQHDELVEKMKTSDFSIMIDESTDLGAVKTLAIVVRIFDEEKFEVKDTFYKSIELNSADHKSIYDAVVQEFTKDGIDYKRRMKGFASDGASVMMGKDNSVARMFQKDCPNLVIIKCTCHSLALCASYACNQLPQYIEQLLKDIYGYLSHSPKRTKEFNSIQEILELKPLKMLNSSATRWLSLESVVKRHLERADEIKLFFSFQANCDRNLTAKRILNHLNDPMTKPILLFLNYALPLINKLNRTFQAEAPEFTHIYTETRTLYLTLLGNICDEQYMKSKIATSDFSDFEKHLKKLPDIYVGVDAAEIATAELDDETRSTFRTICRNFYVELIKQIEKRFDFKDELLRTAALMDVGKFQTLSSLHEISKKFPFFLENCNHQELENEFRELKTNILTGDVQVDISKKSQENWRNLIDVKKADGHFAYPTLRSFVISFFIIPHSSASVERIFSYLNANKTKTRNKLDPQSVDAILRAKAYISARGGCLQIKLTKGLKQKFTSAIYRQHQEDQEKSE